MSYSEDLERVLAQERSRASLGLTPDVGLAIERAVLYAHLQNGELALAALDEAERIEREQGLEPSPRIPINRGAILSRLSEVDAALNEYSRAENMYLSRGQVVHPAIFVNRGSLLGQFGSPAGALDAYDSAERSSKLLGLPLHHTIYLNRAVALTQLTRYEEALVALGAAEHVRQEANEKDDTLIAANRGLVLACLHRFDEAQASLELAEHQTAELGIPPQPLIALHYAVLHLYRGDTTAALASVQEAHSRYGGVDAGVPPTLLQYEKEILMRAALESRPHISATHSPAGEGTVQPTAVLQAGEAGAVKCHDCSIFLSHRRREGHAYARLLKLNFEMRGIHTFLDIDERQPTMRFDERLMRAVEQARSFVVLLTPGALDRCHDAEDWLRKEIRYAIELGKVIVPVMLPGFHWPAEDKLPEDIRPIRFCEGLSYSHEYFPAFIDLLVSWCSRPSGSIA